MIAVNETINLIESKSVTLGEVQQRIREDCPRAGRTYQETKDHVLLSGLSKT